MDVLLTVAATAQPPPRAGLIERFLIVAERGELEPIVVLNKTDLDPSAESSELIRRVQADLADRGVRLLCCSARSGQGLDALVRALAGRRCVLAGASGVGKSTLINALVPQAEIATRAVREKDQRGRHTTTQARVYPLPEGGLVVDTPGVRELGMSLTAAELPWCFPEFEAIAPQCKFHNCTHTHEPNCAVRAAVEAGAVASHRYDSYLRILDTIEHP
jgi:ribosome biogenesis GTPase